MSLGERIKLNRKEKKLTQKQLADIMRIDHTTISKWESNTYEPDTTSLNQLSEIFAVSVDYLTGGKENSFEEFDPEVRSLARDIQSFDTANRGLLKDIIKSMRDRGKEAKDK